MGEPQQEKRRRNHKNVGRRKGLSSEGGSEFLGLGWRWRCWLSVTPCWPSGQMCYDTWLRVLGFQKMEQWIWISLTYKHPSNQWKNIKWDLLNCCFCNHQYDILLLLTEVTSCIWNYKSLKENKLLKNSFYWRRPKPFQIFIQIIADLSNLSRHYTLRHTCPFPNPKSPP